MDPSNKFLVGMNAGTGELNIVRRPTNLTREDALNLAAWLVALADPVGDRFNEVLEAVKNT